MNDMKRVVDTNELKMIKVPISYRECTVCGKWCPRSDFVNDKNTVSRTNCLSCYNMSFEDMKKLSELTKERKQINRSQLYRLKEELSNIVDCEENGMLVEDIIKELKKYPKKSKLLMRLYDSDEGEYMKSFDFDINNSIREIDGITYYHV